MNTPQCLLTIETPEAVSCIDTHADTLLVACEDGTVRRYDLPETKVRKALMGLGSGVSWIRFEGKEKNAWLACGLQLLNFDFSLVDTASMSFFGTILRTGDALERVLVEPEGEDDEINEIAIDKGSLIFTTDSGRVGVLDLQTKNVTFMRQTHRNIAFPIAFVPRRPYEICSGGYDNALLHFDARTKSLLSHLDLGFSFLSFGSHSHPIVAPPADGEESSISLSPPFILSLSISPSDTIAASTASGHIWIGRGGSKEKSQGKRKSRKWNGLKSTEGQWIRVGNGPIVAVAFDHTNDTNVFTLSLRGVLSCWDISSESTQPVWRVESKGIVKATTIVVCERGILACGVKGDRKGVVELWRI